MDRNELVNELARRRGFLWPAFELYGGAAGFYDYGPLGAPLKRRIEDIWRQYFVIAEGFAEIEAPTIGVEGIFQASGHLSGFSDPLTGCKECKEVYRADHLIKHIIEVPDALTNEEIYRCMQENEITCPECGGELSSVYEFNLMFKTMIGPGNKMTGYMRPETAQGMFINFPRLLRYFRGALPFAAVQIGKSYRNEISPRQGVIRLREFTQAEAEIFIDPRDKTHPRFDEVKAIRMKFYSQEAQEKGEEEEMSFGEAVERGVVAHQTLAYYVARTYQYLLAVGIDPQKLRFRQHKSDEMAHYAADCWDAEVLLDRLGWIELVGVADRTDYDLKAHTTVSKVNLSVFVNYGQPKKRKKTVVKPDFKALGPMFKSKAKAVGEALRALAPEQLAGEKIQVNIDGETIDIDRSLVSFESVEEEVRGEEVVPHVIEPSFGIDRILYSILDHSYYEDEIDGEKRAVLRFKPQVAPIEVAVLPLMDRSELVGPAKKILEELRSRGMRTDYDTSGSIGRRYRRNDEIGTPYEVTIDYETIEEGTVTIRDRDSMSQVRVARWQVVDKLQALLNGDLLFQDAGDPVRSAKND
ncbi:MAG: glycine--tRNA ligase [Methanothrix soehngenii]|jgi:glycyl-tRNA synthetase|uniref:glycine--tRNA ligase n=3 Tax=Methanothrix TaxID=2222 RepID=A0A7K4AIX8_METSH|nr:MULTISPECIES: glycine--tRNA ligase [Methanothrix]MBP7066956.1 glycine--tRNA ligase [Methanothrix sp.]MCK9586535.1 glycine--tRNA ligase [Methanothrix soehngenii]MDD3973799.1 glycine--tRNA ligase [Methanothrix soehngenii]MDD4487287.1 glycine--tRNA ligase [Methanothrix soehngenii]MDD5258077.1 glycine--tRNA ligase [Methanothrix soehngenii]